MDELALQAREEQEATERERARLEVRVHELTGERKRCKVGSVSLFVCACEKMGIELKEIDVVHGNMSASPPGQKNEELPKRPSR